MAHAGTKLATTTHAGAQNNDEKEQVEGTAPEAAEEKMCEESPSGTGSPVLAEGAESVKGLDGASSVVEAPKAAEVVEGQAGGGEDMSYTGLPLSLFLALSLLSSPVFSAVVFLFFEPIRAVCMQVVPLSLLFRQHVLHEY